VEALCDNGRADEISALLRIGVLALEVSERYVQRLVTEADVVVLTSGSPTRTKPQAHRVRRKRRRLPPSLLIENASDRLFA
jgi:hypothetical protein